MERPKPGGGVGVGLCCGGCGPNPGGNDGNDGVPERMGDSIPYGYESIDGSSETNASMVETTSSKGGSSSSVKVCQYIPVT